MVIRSILVLALALFLGACGEEMEPDINGDSDGTPTATNGADGTPADTDGTAEVAIDALAFGQQEITVSPGTTVTWVNEDTVGHTVTHGEGGQPAEDARFDEAIGTGEEVSITFDEPGTYPVTCTLHPQMNMTVVVEEE